MRNVICTVSDKLMNDQYELQLQLTENEMDLQRGNDIFNELQKSVRLQGFTCLTFCSLLLCFTLE